MKAVLPRVSRPYNAPKLFDMEPQLLRPKLAMRAEPLLFYKKPLFCGYEPAGALLPNDSSQESMGHRYPLYPMTSLVVYPPCQHRSFQISATARKPLSRVRHSRRMRYSIAFHSGHAWKPKSYVFASQPCRASIGMGDRLNSTRKTLFFGGQACTQKESFHSRNRIGQASEIAHKVEGFQPYEEPVTFQSVAQLDYKRACLIIT